MADIIEEFTAQILERVEERIRPLSNQIETLQAKYAQLESLLQGKRVCVGQTEPGRTNWKDIGRQDLPSVYVDIDTSECGFQSTPIYIVNVHGDQFIFLTSGGCNVYNRTERGFRVYVTFADEATRMLQNEQVPKLTPEKANEWKWHVQWIAIGD
jgi:hypothetical protein